MRDLLTARDRETPRSTLCRLGPESCQDPHYCALETREERMISYGEESVLQLQHSVQKCLNSSAHAVNDLLNTSL